MRVDLSAVLCRDRAIESKEAGLAVLNEAHDLLEGHGVLLRPFRPKFSLLDRQTLRKYSKSGNELGFTQAGRRTDTRTGRIIELKIQVFILEGLPYETFLATAAHELMHAWIHLNGRQDASRWFKEGSCNMAAYLVLRAKRSYAAEYQIEQMRRQTDRVYGKGFRKVLRCAQAPLGCERTRWRARCLFTHPSGLPADRRAGPAYSRYFSALR